MGCGSSNHVETQIVDRDSKEYGPLKITQGPLYHVWSPIPIEIIGSGVQN